MKKTLISLIVLAVLLTSCSAANPTDAVSTIESEASDNATSTNSAPISDEEVYEIFSSLDKRASPVLHWYLVHDFDDLGIAEEPTYSPYHKVSKFSTIAEMKAATDEVFTVNFTNHYFYNRAFVDPSGNDTPLFKEIDGALYRNMNLSGLTLPWTSTDEYYVPYQDGKMIVIAVKTLAHGEEAGWYNFLLKNEDGGWKLDTYYDFNTYLEYMHTYPKKRIEPISNAVSSWFCSQNWSDANQLDANSLINLYLYTYLSDVKEEYDYEKGYKVSAADVLEGLSAYLKDVKMEALISVNHSQGANARYDEETDSFYFDITFDPADYIVISSETKGNITKNITALEIMVIGKSGKAVYTSFLDLEVNGLEIKFLGNRIGEDFR